MTRYTFRVKQNSELEKALEVALGCHGGVTQRELAKGGMSYKFAHTLSVLGSDTDNFSFSRNGVSYVDVVPTTIIKKAESVSAGVLTSSNDNEATESPIMFPETPFVPARMKNFRKPVWYDRMKMMVGAGKHIALAGPPGIGKSTAVEQLAADNHIPLVNISSDAGLRRRDLTGNVELVNSHTQFMVAEYVAAAVNGWWVKIDEVNAAEPDALMFLNSQIAPPYTVNFYGQSMKVHPDFRLFVTYNPGLTGTKPLPESLKDRFFPIKLQFPTTSQLRKLLEANGMPSQNLYEGTYDWTQVIVEYGRMAWESHEMGRMRYQITPRRLMDAVDLVKLADENVFDALEQAVIAAVDNVAESRVLKELLKTLKSTAEFGRM